MGPITVSYEELGCVLVLTQADAVCIGRPAGESTLHPRRITREHACAVIDLVESVLDPVRLGLHVAF